MTYIFSAIHAFGLMCNVCFHFWQALFRQRISNTGENVVKSHVVREAPNQSGLEILGSHYLICPVTIRLKISHYIIQYFDWTIQTM